MSSNIARFAGLKHNVQRLPSANLAEAQVCDADAMRWLIAPQEFPAISPPEAGDQDPNVELLSRQLILASR